MLEGKLSPRSTSDLWSFNETYSDFLRPKSVQIVDNRNFDKFGLKDKEGNYLNRLNLNYLN